MGHFIRTVLLGLILSVVAILPIGFMLLLAAAVAKLYISGHNYALHQKLDRTFFNMPGGQLSGYDLIFLAAVLIVWVSVFSIIIVVHTKRHKRRLIG
ncbi:MAG: hypothetical protein HY422_02775 [Candidatus Komeilibacteria bacterium]|nr:hypothetical protein [Candidatus Komeilibacteria bacterium]